VNALLAVFQTSDKEIGRKPVYRSGDGSDENKEWCNEENRLNLLNEQEICEGQLSEIMGERSYETETHGSEQTWNEIGHNTHGENARNNSPRA